MKMRKRSPPPEVASPMNSSHQSPSSVGGRLSCWVPLALGVQLLILCVTAFALYGGSIGPMQPHALPSSNLGALSDSTKTDMDNNAQLQIRFLHNSGSHLPKIYHDESLPPINGTTQKLKAVPLSGFCKEDLAKSRPKYAIFRDVVLAERKLYVPSTIDCSMLPRDIFLATKFNPGQKSTPKIEVMVVPGANTLEAMEPLVSCHERVYEPSVIFSFINWPQYGHAMFNGISLLWEIFSGPLSDVGKNVRLYAYGDSIVSHERQESQQASPFFDVKTLSPLMSMFSYQPVRSLANLLKQSDRHPVCFSYLLAGLSGDLDHYNFQAPLGKWREFASAVKSHFGVRDPPRIAGGSVKLERVVPPEIVGGGNKSNPYKELGELEAMSWKDLPGRPRLTILDRKYNRVIINVGEIEGIAVDSGVFKSVQVAYLEEMNMAEQIRLMGVTDVLVGMDGTGMMNGIFLPEGGVVVHVRPYGCKRFLSGKGINFNRLWAANPGRVIRHESGDRNSTRFPQNIAEVPELVFSQNSSVAYRYPFILKQDTVVDPAAFRCILDTSSRLLYGKPVDWHRHRSCTRSVFN